MIKPLEKQDPMNSASFGCEAGDCLCLSPLRFLEEASHQGLGMMLMGRNWNEGSSANNLATVAK